LIDRLREFFREGGAVPQRHHHTVEVPGERDATLLLMPAWRTGTALGVKVVTVFPGNDARGLPAVAGLYLLLSAETGEPLALIDGAELTARRTAAASALAAGFLARPHARRMVMVGTGRLAPELVAAHAGVRPIREVAVWGRDPAKAEALAGRLARETGLAAAAAADLEAAVRGADLVSCATTSAEPLVRGAWLRAGTHLDLVGGFTPAMRETDDEAVRRARVWVDTLDGATREAGDIVGPLGSGALSREAIAGDLFGLCRGEAAGRSGPAEITLFKSVGTALEDLAAATLVVGSGRT
jgi:ornithine cyclodeaminase